MPGLTPNLHKVRTDVKYSECKPAIICTLQQGKLAHAKYLTNTICQVSVKSQSYHARSPHYIVSVNDMQTVLTLLLLLPLKMVCQ